MTFTSNDRRLLNGLLVWKPTVDRAINSANIAASSAKSAAGDARSTAILAGQSATKATNLASSTMQIAIVAKDMASELRNTMQGMTSSLHATMKRVDEVAAKGDKGIPDLTAAIKSLQADMNDIKLSVLVQTCSDLGVQKGDLRVYTLEECDAMNGTYSSGECSKKEGGSFSVDCGKLYKGKPVVSKAPSNTISNLPKKEIIINRKPNIIEEYYDDEPEEMPREEEEIMTIRNVRDAVPKAPPMGPLPPPSPGMFPPGLSSGMFPPGMFPPGAVFRGGRKGSKVSRKKRSKTKLSRRRK